MEKSKKLRRYSRKDYTQVVDFPVEIVGRDGVIRRYSFEASVRLYQRRIASASGRYGDSELVAAEISHCRRRIEQLRKSYFHRYGWSGAVRPDGTSVLSGPFAGEVAAFLRRFYGEEAMDELELSWLADADHGPVWFVRRGEDVGYMLYLYQFESFGQCEGREAFFSVLRLLQHAQGQDSETLVAFHHTADCGLVLSGQGEHARRVSPVPVDAELPIELDSTPDDPYAHGLRLLAEGDSAGALVRFEAAVAASPFRRQAIVAVCVVADLLGHPHTAETAARIGVNNFPTDGVLRYHLGLALARTGRFDGALAELDKAVEVAPEQAAARLLRGIVLAQQGSGAALAELDHAVRLAREPEAREIALRLRRGLVARRAMMASIPVAAVLAVAAGFLGSLVLAALAVLVSATAVTAAWSVRQAAIVAHPSRVKLSPPEGLGSRGPRLDDVVT